MKSFLSLALALLLSLTVSAQAATIVSHPPLHTPVLAKDLPEPKGPVYFVDPAAGDDSQPGTKEKPWRTINASLPKLKPGDTLLLRGGTYFENVYCAIVGTEKEPITIRSYPGEVAVIDGGIPEFQTSPATAWKPGEREGEYVSAKAYPNIRDVLGLFADSNIGLQTYWHLNYLNATTEKRTPSENTPDPGYYCGPGLFYDKATGLIHARFAPTTVSPTAHNYSGESDPRKMPLVVSPFRSTPLHVDQGMHLRFQNLVIRGGGWNTVQLSFAVNVTFEYVTIFGGSYCVRAKNSGPVKLAHCGIYGNVPPWGFWSDNALHTYDGVYYDPFTQPPEPRPNRNIARLPTHALLVTEGKEESDIFAFPYNNRWEISHCEFADAHDGVYLNGREMWMHHSAITDIQDDAIYLSNPTPGMNEKVWISHNFVARCTSALGAHLRGGPQGDVYVYNNIFDLRDKYQRYRPPVAGRQGAGAGNLYLPHGRGDTHGMENLFFCHNTVLTGGSIYAGGLTRRTEPRTRRLVYNNIFVYCEKTPPVPNAKMGPGGLINFDGNLHWVVGSEQPVPANWLQAVTESVPSQENVRRWKGQPWDQHSRFGDPRFVQFDVATSKGMDLRLAEDSPAIGLAVDFPESAALRGFQGSRDAGALPHGAKGFTFGINGRQNPGKD